MSHRGIFIDHRDAVRKAPLLSDCIMGHCLAAYRIGLCYLVGILTVLGHVLLRKSDHQGQIASRGVAGDIDLILVSTELLYVFECPCHRHGCIIYVIRTFAFREKTVVHADHSESLPAESLEKLLAATCQTAAMEPYECSESLVCLRIIDIEHTALLPVRIRLICRRIGYVLHIAVAFVLGMRLRCCRKCGDDNQGRNEKS